MTASRDVSGHVAEEFEDALLLKHCVLYIMKQINSCGIQTRNVIQDKHEDGENGLSQCIQKPVTAL